MYIDRYIIYMYHIDRQKDIWGDKWIDRFINIWIDI